MGDFEHGKHCPILNGAAHLGCACRPFAWKSSISYKYCTKCTYETSTTDPPRKTEVCRICRMEDQITQLTAERDKYRQALRDIVSMGAQGKEYHKDGHINAVMIAAVALRKD